MNAPLNFVATRRFKKMLAEDPSSVRKVGLYKDYVAEIKQPDKEQRILQFTISTKTVDRDKDMVDPEGWELANYNKNPIILFAHDNTRPPIGRAPGTRIGKGKLMADAEFMDTDIDTSGFSDMIYRMLKGWFLKATSVGFIPL